MADLGFSPEGEADFLKNLENLLTFFKVNQADFPSTHKSL